MRPPHCVPAMEMSRAARRRRRTAHPRSHDGPFEPGARADRAACHQGEAATLQAVERAGTTRGDILQTEPPLTLCRNVALPGGEGKHFGWNKPPWLNLRSISASQRMKIELCIPHSGTYVLVSKRNSDEYLNISYLKRAYIVQQMTRVEISIHPHLKACLVKGICKQCLTCCEEHSPSILLHTR